MKSAASGRNREEIANQLGMAPKTADVHLTNIRKKIGAPNTLTTVLAAVRAGLVGLDELPECDLKVYLPNEELHESKTQ